MRSSIVSLMALSILSQGASAQARSQTVPFVGCAADGQGGHVAPPQGEPKVVDSSTSPLEGIAYYQGEQLLGVFAPAGWHCHIWYGSGGSSILVTPTPIDTVDAPYDAKVSGPAVELTVDDGGTSGRFEVATYGARLFPTALAGFIARVKAEHLAPDSEFDSRQFAHDAVVAMSRSEAAFTTPARARGLGTRESLGPSSTPIRGIAILTADPQEPDLVILGVRLSTAYGRLESAVLELNRLCMEAGDACAGPQ